MAKVVKPIRPKRMDGGSEPGPGPEPDVDNLLAESGDNLLNESGDLILVE